MALLDISTGWSPPLHQISPTPRRHGHTTRGPSFWLPLVAVSKRSLRGIWVTHGSLNVPIFHITQPLGIWSIMATIRWCPIFPKWDSYQPLSHGLQKCLELWPFFEGKNGASSMGWSCFWNPEIPKGLLSTIYPAWTAEGAGEVGMKTIHLDIYIYIYISGQIIIIHKPELSP